MIAGTTEAPPCRPHDPPMLAPHCSIPRRSRPDRSARRAATQRTCQTWAAEAALRMLMNNLDPEVAEDPANLVVYGGSGKAARDWPSFQAIVRGAATARAGRDAARAIGQARRASSARTTQAPRVLIANSQPRRQVGDVGALPRARGREQDDVRPDDGRLVDLHRHAGDPAGHVRDVRGVGARSTSAAA